MKKRILSITLALLMVLALLPFGALAADRPAAAPYKPTIKIIMGQANDRADGLFADIDGDGVPELLVAYEFYDGVRGASLYALEDGKSKWLVNADNLRGDLTFSSNDYSSIDVVSRSGSAYVMASRTSFSESEVDETYGQTYWDCAEFWLYQYASGSLRQVDHWSYALHELADGRYFEGEGGIKHNGAPASAASLDAFLDSVSIVCTVSLFDDTNGVPLPLLLRVTEGKFVDVDPEAFYALPVDWAVAQGITNGTSLMTFAPTDPCTRGQVVTFLWRAAGSPEPKSAKNPFSDVKSSAFYYKAVLWAVEQGITKGTSASAFSPGAPCTRGQVVTFLHRNAGSPKITASNPFQDVRRGAFYYDAVLWAVKNEITKGTSAAAFSPDDTCTRGQIVTFLYRNLADQTQPISGTLQMATGGAEGSNYHEHGAALAWCVSTYTDTEVTAVEGAGSEANLSALTAGDVQLCFCRSDVADAAFHGTRGYAGTGANQDFSVVTALYMNPIRIVTYDESLLSVEDLRGKAVALGEKGSALYYNALDILGVYGLTEADVRPVYKGLADAAKGLRRGEIAAAFALAGRDESFETALGDHTGSYRFVMMDDAHIDALIASAPYYTRKPADIELYGMIDDAGTVSVSTLLLARNDVSNEDAYNVVSAILNPELMNPALTVPAAGQMLVFPGYASGVQGIPYHPGAAAYFEGVTP